MFFCRAVLHVTKRVGVALRMQRLNGAVRSEYGTGQYMVWEIAV
jgi:hypothetical protein